MPREIQYIENLALIEKMGFQKMGPMASWAWLDDPKHLLFTLSRYKFVAKMFTGFNKVLEIGCGDAFASRIVAQSVNNLDVSDFDENLVSLAEELNYSTKWKMKYHVIDPVKNSINTDCYDGIYALDVMEHIDSSVESTFLKNIINALSKHGTFIIGMPSLESQLYASAQSKQGHVNCKTQSELKKVLEKWFYNVFIFSMNDEVVHTGFPQMSHYNFALCCGKKINLSSDVTQHHESTEC